MYCLFPFVDFKIYRGERARIYCTTAVIVAAANNKACYYSNKRIGFMDTNDRVRVSEFDGRKSVANSGYGRPSEFSQRPKNISKARKYMLMK